MKRTLIALAAASSVFLLAGCNDQKACIEAISEANRSSFDAVAKQAEAMLLALKGDDAQAKGMALMWFATQDRRLQVMGYGDCNRDSALEWAKVLVNPLVNVWAITDNGRTARHNSDNAVQTQAITFGTLETISVKGMDEAGKVVFPPVYTVPMGSAPAAAAPTTPAPAEPAPVATP